jgi:hypothetical protein
MASSIDCKCRRMTPMTGKQVVVEEIVDTDIDSLP